MFFRKIENWSKKRMWVATIICYLFYFSLVLLAPTITVMIKYKVFQKTEKMRNITGFGIIVVVICGITSFLLLKKTLRKLPQISANEQRFKFGLETLFNCFPIGITLFAMFVVKDDVMLAFETLQICVWFFLGGILFEGLFIKFIDAEWAIRQGAKFDKEKAKRSDVV